MPVDSSTRSKNYRERQKSRYGHQWLQRESERQKSYYVPVDELPRKDKAKRRERNRLKVERCRLRKLEQQEAVQLGFTPPRRGRKSLPGRLNVALMDTSSSQKGRKGGKKRAQNALKKAHGDIKKLEQEQKRLQKTIWRLEKRSQRAAKRSKKSVNPSQKAKHDLIRAGLKPGKHPQLLRKLKAFHALCDQTKEVSAKKKYSRKQTLEEFVAGRLTKKYRLLSYFGKVTGLNRNNLKSERKEKKRMAKERMERRRIVDTFYNRDDVSRMKPGQKDYTILRVQRGNKCKAEKLQTRVLLDYQRNNWEKFLAENISQKLSLALFCRLRPKNIKLTRFTDRNECQCIYHQNIALKCRAVGITGSPDYIIGQKSEKEIVNSATKVNELGNVNFYEWGKEKEGEKNITKCTAKTMKKDDFLVTFEIELRRFRQHVRRIKEQFSAIKELKTNLATDEVVICMDFSENFSCRSLDEVQSAYWSQRQISLHPAIMYHRTAEEEELEHNSHIYISDQTAHNPIVVLNIILMMNKLIPKDKKILHFVTDGPTSQYRNRTMFHLIGNVGFYLGREHVSWTYHEVGHGKGGCDGVGGTVKRKLAEGVKQGKAVIQSAKEAIEYLEREKSSLNYHLYEQKDIDAAANIMKNVDPVAVVGTMTLHAVKSTTTPGEIKRRETACFCPKCKTDQDACPGWLPTRVLKQMGALNNEGVQTSKGQWVAAEYNGEIYIGRVVKEDMRRKRCSINFLLNSVMQPSLYKWPKEKQELWVDFEDVISNVSLEEVDNGPRKPSVFRLDQEQIKAAGEILARRREI